MRKGWVKLWRESVHSKAWETVYGWRLWTYLLIRAAWETTEMPPSYLVEGEPTALAPGEVLFGRTNVAKATGLTPKQLEEALKRLEKGGSVTVQKRGSRRGSRGGSRYRVVTIANWERYQTVKEPKGQPKGQHKGQHKGQPNGHIEEEKTFKKEEQNSFVRFWATYPKARRVKKKAALAKWPLALAEAAKDGITPDDILAALEAHVAGWEAAGTEPRHIPHPVVWLNKARWADEAVEQAAATKAAQDAQAAVDAQCYKDMPEDLAPAYFDYLERVQAEREKANA